MKNVPEALNPRGGKTDRQFLASLEGKAMPDHLFPTTAAGSVNLCKKQQDGKKLVLVVFAILPTNDHGKLDPDPWDGHPCIHEARDFNRLRPDLSRNGFDLLGVSSLGCGLEKSFLKSADAQNLTMISDEELVLSRDPGLPGMQYFGKRWPHFYDQLTLVIFGGVIAKAFLPPPEVMPGQNCAALLHYLSPWMKE